MNGSYGRSIARFARSKDGSWNGQLDARRLSPPGSQPGQQLLTYTAPTDRACRLWREYRAGAAFRQPGGFRGQFHGCEKDGQKPANALVHLGRSSHAQVRAAMVTAIYDNCSGTSRLPTLPSTLSSTNLAFAQSA